MRVNAGSVTLALKRRSDVSRPAPSVLECRLFSKISLGPIEETIFALETIRLASQSFEPSPLSFVPLSPFPRAYICENDTLMSLTLSTCSFSVVNTPFTFRHSSAEFSPLKINLLPCRNRPDTSDSTIHRSNLYRQCKSYGCVPNISVAGRHISTPAISNAILPYAVKLADFRWKEACRRESCLAVLSAVLKRLSTCRWTHGDTQTELLFIRAVVLEARSPGVRRETTTLIAAYSLTSGGGGGRGRHVWRARGVGFSRLCESPQDKGDFQNTFDFTQEALRSRLMRDCPALSSSVRCFEEWTSSNAAEPRHYRHSDSQFVSHKHLD
jgi:hypothetical protein